jgi:two-component system, sensor histidine kinase and response regulator
MIQYSLVFTDTGIGIRESDMERLFDEFVRIKNEKTKDISGSGLGLSIVKKVVELYNGTISSKVRLTRELLYG